MPTKCLQAKKKKEEKCVYIQVNMRNHPVIELFKNCKPHKVLGAINTFKFQNRATILKYNWHKILMLPHVERHTINNNRKHFNSVLSVVGSVLGSSHSYSFTPDNLPIRQVLLRLSPLYG